MAGVPRDRQPPDAATLHALGQFQAAQRRGEGRSGYYLRLNPDPNYPNDPTKGSLTYEKMSWKQYFFSRDQFRLKNIVAFLKNYSVPSASTQLINIKISHATQGSTIQPFDKAAHRVNVTANDVLQPNVTTFERYLNTTFGRSGRSNFIPPDSRSKIIEQLKRSFAESKKTGEGIAENFFKRMYDRKAPGSENLSDRLSSDQARLIIQKVYELYSRQASTQAAAPPPRTAARHAAQDVSDASQQPRTRGSAGTTAAPVAQPLLQYGAPLSSDSGVPTYGTATGAAAAPAAPAARPLVPTPAPGPAPAPAAAAAAPAAPMAQAPFDDDAVDDASILLNRPPPTPIVDPERRVRELVQESIDARRGAPSSGMTGAAFEQRLRDIIPNPDLMEPSHRAFLEGLKDEYEYYVNDPRRPFDEGQYLQRFLDIVNEKLGMRAPAPAQAAVAPQVSAGQRPAQASSSSAAPQDPLLSCIGQFLRGLNHSDRRRDARLNDGNIAAIEDTMHASILEARETGGSVTVIFERKIRATPPRHLTFDPNVIINGFNSIFPQRLPTAQDLIPACMQQFSRRLRRPNIQRDAGLNEGNIAAIERTMRHSIREAQESGISVREIFERKIRNTPTQHRNFNANIVISGFRSTFPEFLPVAHDAQSSQQFLVQHRSPLDPAGRYARVCVFHQTRAAFYPTGYMTQGDRWHNISQQVNAMRTDTEDHGVKPTEAPLGTQRNDPLPNRGLTTQIRVVNEDSLTAARALMQQDPNARVAVLNMARKDKPGGFVEHGAQAQEEDLCRSTTLLAGLKGVERRQGGQYRIPEHGTILSNGVQIIRGSENEGYPFIDPVSIDVISSASYNSNRAHGSGYDRPNNDRDFEEGTKEKIRAILRTAARNRNDHLILSAFGCGAYRNDPEVMSRLFHEVLNSADGEFRGLFKSITFAITGRPQSAPQAPGRPALPPTNFQAFQERFQPSPPQQSPPVRHLPA